MSAIKDAVQHITHGIAKAVEGIGHIAKGVLTLNPSELGKGIKEGVQGVTETARGAIDAFPPSLAFNTLTHNSLDKLLGRVENHLDRAAGRVVDGAGEFAEGLVTGDKSKMAEGLGKAAWGGVSLASAATPMGMARTFALEGVKGAAGLPSKPAEA